LSPAGAPLLHRHHQNHTEGVVEVLSACNALQWWDPNTALFRTPSQPSISPPSETLFYQLENHLAAQNPQIHYSLEMF